MKYLGATCEQTGGGGDEVFEESGRSDKAI